MVLNRNLEKSKHTDSLAKVPSDYITLCGVF